MPVICAHCGCDNPDGIAYCRDCGMTLRSNAPRVAAPTPTPELASAQQPGSASPPAWAQTVWSPQAADAAAANAPKVATAPLAGGPVTAGYERPGSVNECPRCHSRNPAESRFCHACGATLTPAAATPSPPAVASPPQAQSNKCPRCQGATDPGADFCKFCGARLTQSAPTPIVVATPQPAAPVPQPLAAPAQPLPPPQPVRSLGAEPLHPVPAPAMAANRQKALASTNVELAAPIAAAVQAYANSAAEPRPPAAPAAPPPTVSATPQAIAANASPAALASVEPTPATNQPADDRKFGATKPLRSLAEVVAVARLVQITKEGNEGAVYPVTQEQTDIGRSEGQIVLPDDPYLSPRHARIVAKPRTEGGPVVVSIADLGSVNGVFVRLRAPRTLLHGDLLLIGQQVLRFEAVTDIEGARGPAMQHGVLLFGSPAPAVRARLAQRTVEGLVRDVIYLVREETVLGRETGDRTFPDDVFLSRRHCAVRREATGFSVADLGSSNGTFVEVRGEQILSDGDQLRIGHHLFRVDMSGSSTEAARGSA